MAVYKQPPLSSYSLSILITLQNRPLSQNNLLNSRSKHAGLCNGLDTTHKH